MRIKITSTIRFAALLCLGLTLVRCGNDSKDPVAAVTASEFTAVYNILEPRNCFTCHKGDSPSEGKTSDVLLDFTNQTTAYTGLTTMKVTSTENIECRGLSLVKSGSPETSYLMPTLFEATINFAGVTNCTPTTRHHTLLGFPISAADKTTVSNWIKNGAKQ